MTKCVRDHLAIHEKLARITIVGVIQRAKF